MGQRLQDRQEPPEGCGGEENLSRTRFATVSVEQSRPFSSTNMVEDDERLFPPRNRNFWRKCAHGSNTDYIERPRWTLQQLMSKDLLPDHKQILIYDGMGVPMLAYRQPYTRSAWASRFDDNPFEGKRRAELPPTRP